jgi:carboxypeptidase C (cathepsin A)
MAMMFKLGAAGGDPPGSHPLRRAMLANPKLQVFSALGRYDGYCAARNEEIRSADPSLRKRIRAGCYTGGHMFYSDKLAREQVQHDFDAFVRSAAGQ